jgi:hypothetical protein
LLSSLLAVPVHAQERAAYFDQNGPVIIDRSAALDHLLASQLRARPVPRSQADTAQVISIGNIRIERRVEIACGDRTPDRLVLCLDTTGQFPAADELILLARATAATRIEVGSSRAHGALLSALQAAEVVPAVEPVITGFSDCTGACDGRVVIGSAP